MSERINMTVGGELRDRLEAWRADQYEHQGRIPSLSDAARILIHQGLVSAGFPPDPTGGKDE
jgi:hypothetical protein